MTQKNRKVIKLRVTDLLSVILPFLTGVLGWILSYRKTDNDKVKENHDYIKEENNRLNEENKRLTKENDELRKELRNDN